MEASKAPSEGQPPDRAETPASGAPGEAHSGGDSGGGSIAGAAGILGILTLLSRFAGLARDVVIGSLFGASPAADAFFVAFRIPNLFRRIVAEGAASTAFVPVFTGRLATDGREAALRSSGAVGAAAVIVLASIVAAGVVFSESVVDLFAPGFAADPDKHALAVDLVAWTFPYLFLVGMAAWAMGTLHTFRRFAAPAYGPVLLNVSIISCALLLAPRLERPVFALVWGVLIGGFAQFAVQWPALSREGMRPSALGRVSDPAVGRVGALLVPTLFGGAVYQINILVATMLASLLPDRSVSYLWYADRIFEFPLGIIAVAVGTAALPSLSAQASRGEFGEMADSVSYSLRLVWSLCIPATLGLWLLAPEIVTLLFERGRFSAVDSAQTAWALRAYVFGLLGVASVRVLVSVFYAMEQPKVTVRVAVLALLVNIVADVALMGPTTPQAGWWAADLLAGAHAAIGVADLRHAGLALGTGIAATVNALVLWFLARRRLPQLAAGPLASSAALHGAAALAMAAVVYGALSILRPYGAAVTVAAAVAVGGAVYLGAALALGSRELGAIVAAVRRRISR